MCAALLAIGLPEQATARPTDDSGPQLEDAFKYGSNPERRLVCVRPQKREICVHRVARGAQRATKAQAKETAAVFAAAWSVEVEQLGFRKPPVDRAGALDGRHGAAFDVYLANTGLTGSIEGYCDPGPKGKAAGPYCVVDNDFGEFVRPGVSAEAARQVTAAHELFHAVQAAYDRANEPAWLVEGTAVWMEDQVFDTVNQSYGFLDASPLASPEVRLDTQDGASEYGAWIFWRFLSESQPGGADVIRQVWSQAAGGPESDTLDVETAVSAAGGVAFSELFARFGAWNYALGAPPGSSYEEGAGYLATLLDRRPPLDAEYELGPARAGTGSRTLDVGPLSTAYVAFVSTASCTVTVTAGSQAEATLVGRHGAEPSPTFDPPVSIEGASGAVALAPGEAAILVLGNPTAGPATYSYGATAVC